MRELVCILNTPIDVLDTQGVMARLEQFIEERRFHQVATANADFLINAMPDPELRHILRQSDLVMPDGMPLVWASRSLGCPLPERVTGADIVPALAELSARKGYRIYMLGARPEVAQRAKARMLEKHPTLQIVGCVSPPVKPLDSMDNVQILQEIHAAQPDILLVAFGNPKQEKWIYRNRENLANIPICIGVGGTFDFMAGETTRAPEWMRRSGLEWLFRLSQEPKRLWKRYTRDIVHFGREFTKQWSVSRPQKPTRATVWHETPHPHAVVLAVDGPLNVAQCRELQTRVATILDQPSNAILDLSNTDYLDAAIVGTLMNLPKRAAFSGQELRICGAKPALLRILNAAHVEECIDFYSDPVEALKDLPQNQNSIRNKQQKDSKTETDIDANQHSHERITTLEHELERGSEHELERKEASL